MFANRILRSSSLYARSLPNRNATAPLPKALNAIRANFQKEPVASHFNSKAFQFPYRPPANKILGIQNRSLSTSRGSDPLADSLTEESAINQIKKNPEKAKEIIQRLSSPRQKQLALTLAKHAPHDLIEYIDFFEIQEEKSRVELFLLLFNSAPNSKKERYFHVSLLENFKKFKISDKDFVATAALLYSSRNNVETLQALTKKLPVLNNQDFHLIEITLLVIFDKNPTSFTENLQRLQLPQEVLLKVLPEMIKNATSHETFRAIAQVLPALNIKDESFILRAVMDLLNIAPTSLAGNLKSFNFPSNLLQTIIPKILSGHIFPFSLTLLVEELPHLSIANNAKFMEEITLKILDLTPYPLIGQLKHLHLKEEALKNIISLMIDRLSSRNYTSKIAREQAYEVLIEELVALVIKDPIFIENSLLAISEKNPKAVIKVLQNFEFKNKKTLEKIILNTIPEIASSEELDLITKTIKTINLEKPDSILPTTLSLLQAVTRLPWKERDWTKKNKETHLTDFVQTLGIEDITVRKDILERLIKSSIQNLGFYTKLLGLDSPGVFEKILLDVITKEKVSSNTLSRLLNDSYLADKISPLFFISRWTFEATLSSPHTSTPNEALLPLLEKKDSFFKNRLITTLVRLDTNDDIAPQQKINMLVTLFDLTKKPPPSLAEITGNLILFDLTTSKYQAHVYDQRLEEIHKLDIQNPHFFEKAAIIIAKMNPEDVLTFIEKFNLSKTETLEAIVIEILLKKPSLFFFYRDALELSKDSILTILSEYATRLHIRNESSLSPKALTEIFSQIIKYRNKPLSDAYLKTLLENISSKKYQLALEYYTVPKKTKNSPPIFIHKILPSLFFAKWDPEMRETTLPARQILSEFLQDSEIRKTLRNSAEYPLLQTLLLAELDLDKEPSLNPGEKLKLIAWICNLQKNPTSAAQEITKNLRTLSFLSSLKSCNTLVYDLSESSSEELFRVFKKIALQNSLVRNLYEIEQVEEKYIEIFIKKALIPGGLAAYEAQLKFLPPSEKTIQELTRFVKSCLLETSIEERYRVDINANLQSIAKKYPLVFERWKSSLPTTTIQVDKKNPKADSLQSSNFLSLIEKELNFYSEEQKLKIETTTDTLSKLEKALLNPKEQLDLLKILEKDLYLLDPVPMDALQAITNRISLIHSSQKQDVSLKDIDDPKTLFELPTLVSATCQGITALPGFNQCLINLAIGGNTRMITLQNSSGKFIARAILRIFNDHPKPFLLLEPVYTSQEISHEEAKKAILEGALTKAISLDIPLFLSDPEGSKDSKKMIFWAGHEGSIFYSDLCFDEETKMHVIQEKKAQILLTSPLKRAF